MRKIEYPIAKALSYFKKIDPLGNYLLFSEPRGGSTWLAQIIHQLPETALIWEPINPKVYTVLRKQKFGWRQYIPADAVWPEIELFLGQVFSGKALTYHTASHTRVMEYLRARHLVVKFCRGNALLPWITKRFDFNNKPVYLVRHPFAVVSSQLKHGAWAEDSPTPYIPSTPYNDDYLLHWDYLKTLRTQEETLVARWCMSNMRTLETSAEETRWIRIHYETLFRFPDHVLEKIFGEWGLAVPDDAASVARKPSSTAKGTVLVSDADRQLSKWQTHLAPEIQQKMQRVLDHFEITAYSVDSTDPLDDGLPRD